MACSLRVTVTSLVACCVSQDDLAELEVENEALGKITAKQTPESVRIEGLEAEIEAINAEMEEKARDCVLLLTRCRTPSCAVTHWWTTV